MPNNLPARPDPDHQNRHATDGRERMRGEMAEIPCEFVAIIVTGVGEHPRRRNQEGSGKPDEAAGKGFHAAIIKQFTYQPATLKQRGPGGAR